MKNQVKPVGRTKDAGWQFGLRQTFKFPQDYLWDFMFSEKGLKIWMGQLKGELESKKTFKTTGGAEGIVKVLKPYSHIRMTWKKKNWKNVSTVQVRVMGGAEKATISFHQEKLSGNRQREEMKRYWNKRMKAIEKTLGTSEPG